MQVYTTLKKLRGAGIVAGLRPDDAPIDIITILETDGLDAVLQIPHYVLCGQGLERRKRLFAVACCQNVWHLLNDTGRQAIRAAHLYAHKEVTLSDLEAAINAARYTAWHEAVRLEVRVAVHGALLFASKQSFRSLASGAATIAAETAIKNTDGFVDKGINGDIAWNAAWKAAREYQTAVFKTIFSGDY